MAILTPNEKLSNAVAIPIDIVGMPASVAYALITPPALLSESVRFVSVLAEPVNWSVPPLESAKPPVPKALVRPLLAIRRAADGPPSIVIPPVSVLELLVKVSMPAQVFVSPAVGLSVVLTRPGNVRVPSRH
jgi:hypothetical protein